MDNQEQIKAVACMQKYIEDNIKKPITLYDIAKAAGYSPWHSARIFKEYTGKNPFCYIRSLRLSRAAVSLRDDNKKIIDIALDFVFDSHEGFTKAFSKQFGLSPKRYSMDTPPIKLFMPYRVTDFYNINKEGEEKMEDKTISNTIFVQVIEKPKRKMILKRGIKAKDYYEYCGEVGCDIFGILCSIKDALYEPMGLWLPEKLIKPNTSLYVQGVEVASDYNKQIPQGFDIIELPACKMMIFQGQPFEDSEFETAIRDLWNAIDNYDPSLYGFEWSHEAPRFQLNPQGYRGYIEGRPVRVINNK